MIENISKLILDPAKPKPKKPSPPPPPPKVNTFTIKLRVITYLIYNMEIDDVLSFRVRYKFTWASLFPSQTLYYMQIVVFFLQTYVKLKS